MIFCYIEIFPFEFLMAGFRRMGVSKKWVKALLGLQKSGKSQSLENDENVGIYPIVSSHIEFCLFILFYDRFTFKVLRDVGERRLILVFNYSALFFSKIYGTLLVFPFNLVVYTQKC